MAQRDLYIDRLRTVMTAIVVVFHAAITYGASGGWFYHEVNPSASPSSLLLTIFVSTKQAYFMGFFFLLAGYFTPASLERKGYGRFILDRFLRLGLPLLAFGLILGPIAAGMVNAAQGPSNRLGSAVMSRTAASSSSTLKVTTCRSARDLILS